jgi:cell division ATPase FtsA
VEAREGRESATIIGLDIGDGESSLAYLSTLEDHDFTTPATIYTRTRTRERSIVTAMGRSAVTGRRLIGEEAVSATGAVQFSVNFKHAPHLGALATPDSVLFAEALLDEFFQETGISKEECIVYIGHPTGWAKDSVEEYSAKFGSLGIPVRLIPESHSALIHVRDRRLTGNPWHTTALIIDIGSSTTDCTLVDDMVPYNLAAGSELGCQQIDRELADRVTNGLMNKEFQATLEMDGGRELLLLACRRVKEGYFAGKRPQLLMFGDEPINPKFDSIVDQAFGWLRGIEIAEIVNAPGGWRDRFRDLLVEVLAQIRDRLPQLIILTGGGSRMSFVRDVVAEIFPGAEIEDDLEPSFSVARGLASNARHRRNVTRFRQEVAEIAQDPVISSTVAVAMDTLVTDIKNKLTELESHDVAEAVNFAKALSADSSSNETIDFSQYVADINHSISQALSPSITETCSRYGVEEYALTFSMQFPELITDDLVRIINNQLNRLPVNRNNPPGSRVVKAAMNTAMSKVMERRGKYNPFKSSTKSSNMETALLIIDGVTFVSLFTYSLLTNNQQNTTRLDINALQIQVGEAERFAESVREQVADQLMKRAEEIERFLA